MSASLIETLQGLVTPALMQSVRAALGEPESAVRAGFGAAISRILAALLNGAGDRDLVGTVASLVGDIAREPSAISNVAGLLTGGVPSSTAALAGNKLLGTLFGSRLGGVTQAVAAASDLKPQSASALLSVAGPLVLSALGSKLGGGSVSGPALAGLLTQEASALGAGFMPALSGAAQTAKPFAATSASPARAAPASPPAARPQPAAASNDGLFRSFLWLLLPLAFIGWLFWQKISAPVEAPAPAPAAAPKSAAPAPAEEKKAEAAPAAAIAPVPEPAPAPAPAPVPATALTPGPNGLIQQTLTGGEVIEIAPGGVESKVIAFLEDPTSVVDKNVWFDFDRLSFETRSSTLVAELDGAGEGDRRDPQRLHFGQSEDRRLHGQRGQSKVEPEVIG